MHSYIDIHSHLNDARFDTDLTETLVRMREANVSTIVVGTDMAMSQKAVMLADQHPDIWATVGIHPTDNHKEIFHIEEFEALSMSSRVVAIGECGLDYYWPSHDGWKAGEKEEKARQRDIFEKQIAVAVKIEKPLMIHGRPTPGSMDAYEDILDVLKQAPDIRGNVHFFVGDISIAKRFLDIGFTMSFTGVVTFTHDYDEVVRYLPLDSMMAETDSPYVAPVPHRGKRNEPAYVPSVYSAIAKIRGIDVDFVRETFSKTIHRVFDVSCPKS